MLHDMPSAEALLAEQQTGVWDVLEVSLMMALRGSLSGVYECLTGVALAVALSKPTVFLCFMCCHEKAVVSLSVCVIYASTYIWVHCICMSVHHVINNNVVLTRTQLVESEPEGR